nr:MAG TPA_asm: hypothetical protein [Caudoviricetes sp.]
MPIFKAKSFLSVILFSFNSRSKASINRLEISFFVLIIQNIEFFMPKYLAVNTEFCIFAACLKIEHVAKGTNNWRENGKIIGI